MTDTRITQFVNGPVVGTTRFTRANADNGLAHDLHTVEIGGGITLMFSAGGLDRFIDDLSVAQSRLLTEALAPTVVNIAEADASFGYVRRGAPEPAVDAAEVAP